MERLLDVVQLGLSLHELDRSVHELLVEIVRDCPHPKSHKGSLAERSLIRIEAAQDQPPASVVLGGLHRIGVTQAVVPLQQVHHRQ